MKKGKYLEKIIQKFISLLSLDFLIANYLSYKPDGDQETPFTSFSCPSRVAMLSNWWSFMPQMVTVPSKLAEAYSK
jgi:hypothetical protein